MSKVLELINYPEDLYREVPTDVWCPEGHHEVVTGYDYGDGEALVEDLYCLKCAKLMTKNEPENL